MIKKLPTSQSSLKRIIDKNLVFVDKTKSIETYENSKQAVSMFLRPRRFGKTMFIEMLKYYYDEALKDESAKIFEGTYIASHPTEKKNGYYVVSFDFSGIGTNNGIDKTLEAFTDNIINGIGNFYQRYPDLIPRDIRKMKEQEQASLEDCIIKYYTEGKRFSDSTAIIKNFLTRLQALQNKIMVLIDEYDNFTNDILSRDVITFAELARKGGDISTFYQVLRSCQQQNIIDRIFIAGVLPITLDTSLSGFVFDRVYEYPEFNEMAGFTDDDVASLLRDTVNFDKCGFSLDTLREEMKRRYNGYRFAEEGEFTIYNPALCLNFIKKLISLGYKKIPPLQTVSGNDIDFKKFAGYMNLVNRQDMDSIIDSIDVDSDPDNPSSAGYIGIYALSESIKVTSDESRLNYSEGATLLYHLGFLTIMTDQEASSVVKGYRSGVTYLRIPNLYYKSLFSKYHLSRYPEAFSNAVEKTWDIQLADTNDISSLKNMLKSIAGAFVNTSDTHMGESQLVLAVYVALNMISDAPFNLVREYSIKHANQHVFSDGLEEDEYQDVDEQAVEKELIEEGIIPKPEKNENNDTSSAAGATDEASEQDNLHHDFTIDFLNQDDDQADESAQAALKLKRGRADLVAINTKGGPSYIFEFKYHRDSNARKETKYKVCRILLERAQKQLAFYVTDDRLSKLPDFHKYVVIYAYGDLYIKEIR